MSFSTKQMILNTKSRSVGGTGTKEECQLKLEKFKRIISSATQLEAIACTDYLMEGLKKLSDSYVIMDMPADTAEESIAIYLNQEKEHFIETIKKTLISPLDVNAKITDDYSESCQTKLLELLPGNSHVKEFILSLQYFLYYNYNNNPEELKGFLKDYIAELAESTSYE